MKDSTETLSEVLNQSPSVELLRLRNREIIILFLYETFYQKRHTVSYEHLSIQLTDYLTYMHVEKDEENGIEQFDSYEEKAKKYILRWTDKGFLRNWQDETGEIFYELSSYTSKTIDWLLSLKREVFVGTESKFMNLFGQMKELVEFTNEDTEQRISILEAKKREIEHQIQTIRAGGDAKVFEEYQILPRFHQITQSAKELLSDFKEVEDNFKSITKSIYQKHAEGELTKGEILGYTFDALDNLQRSQQGKSFYAFWDFLLSPSLQNTWDGLVDELYDTLNERKIPTEEAFLKNMKQYLYAAGKKVYKANDKMAEKLSRIISESNTQELATTQRVINEIQSTLIKLAQQNLKPDISLEIETIPDISMPNERRLTLERYTDQNYDQPLELAATDIADASHAENLFIRHSVDRAVLNLRIKQALQRKRQVLLTDVIAQNGGLEKGLAELFGYFSVLRNFKYVTSNEKTCIVEFNHEQKKTITIPEIILVR